MSGILASSLLAPWSPETLSLVQLQHSMLRTLESIRGRGRAGNKSMPSLILSSSLPNLRIQDSLFASIQPDITYYPQESYQPPPSSLKFISISYKRNTAILVSKVQHLPFRFCFSPISLKSSERFKKFKFSVEG